MLTHRSIGANLDAAVRLLSELGVGYDDRFLSFLPMAHAYEHMAGLHLPIALGSELWFCESTDKLQQYLQEAQPSMATAVPRLYDLLHARITAQVKNAPPTKQKLFNAAVTLGRKRLAGEKLSMLESLFDKLLDRLVRKKVKERFGGRIRYFISGGAALNLEVGHFFTSLGLGIIQGYGQTEASPLISVNHPNRVKLHTVGEPMDNVEARLAEDGELLVRGDCVMKGYWEDEKSTQGTIIDGWLHTGDLAVIDEDGYIEIVGRKKDLIVTSGGDNVAPAKIEAALCAHPEIEQAVVFGDGRPWLGAVIIPSPDEGADESQIEACVRQVNQQLNNYERVRKFVIQTEVCSIENGLLTPTQKVKRDKVLAINHEQISVLY
jgi:long-chain acyl-CoA synthetase